MSLKKRIYEGKGKSYFSNVRNDIVALVPDGENKVLEVGCGRGMTLRKLKDVGKASSVVGVDMIEHPDFQLDGFIAGDIEKEDLPYPEGYFDVIICADVLEHLTDPWETLKKLVRYLRAGGLFILSIPNIRDVKTLYRVAVKGRFRYEEEGVLDRTHLRFFCKGDVLAMVSKAGLKPDEIRYLLGPKRKTMNFLTLGLLKDFLAVQYIVAAKK